MKISKVLLSTLTAAVMGLTGCQSLENHQNQNGDNSVMIKPTIQVTKDKLMAYHWHLAGAVDANNQPINALNTHKEKVSLNFIKANGSERISFSAGCNNMGGGYALEGNSLKLGNIMSTQKMCQELDMAERLLANAMEGTSQLEYEMQGDYAMLTQTTADGSKLMWKGVLTPEARYRQQGETVYWEIASDQQVCADGKSNDCLKVRPISYDDKGVKTVEGQWGVFQGNIEGYTHNDNLHKIVRLKRFVVDPVNVKGKRYAYVFDMVVESSVADNK